MLASDSTCQQTKRCYECGEEKDVSLFYSRRQGHRRERCAPCHTVMVGRHKALRREASPRAEWAKDAVRGARNRASRAGIPFEIDAAQVEALTSDTCPVLGIPLVYPTGHGEGGRRGASPNSASIDRVVPALGYVPGNVQVISYRANTVKNNANAAELLAVAKHCFGHEPLHQSTFKRIRA